MARENYRKLMTDNAKCNFVSVLALSDNQLKGFKRFCKRNDTPSGNDRKNHFFIYCGLYGYHLDFIKTTDSGAFVKIKKFFTDRLY